MKQKFAQLRVGFKTPSIEEVNFEDSELVQSNVYAYIQQKAKQLVSECKFQALVYDILPSITAVFSYAIGS